MTETGAAACIMANREPRHVGTNCFGRAEPFVETRSRRRARAPTSPSTRPASCWCAPPAPTRARDFFLGYLKDEPATEEAWADGWFHTGDVVRRGAEGDFHFVDRRKNVIRRSGENISAVEVESVLNQHPAVAASAVAATPDPVRGDEVLACIVLRKAPNLPPPRAASRPASSAMRSSGSPTSRRRATSPSSTRCRSRSRRRSSAASCASWRERCPASRNCIDTREHEAAPKEVE